MKIIIFFLVALSCFQINTQSQSLPLKEEYDTYNHHRVTSTFYNNAIPPTLDTYNPCYKDFQSDATIFGDGMAKVLEGYISMFEATGDKAYLNKFVLQSLCIMENRHDFNTPFCKNEPRWVDEDKYICKTDKYIDEIMYHDGYLCAAFGRFIHFIKLLHPELYYEQIISEKKFIIEPNVEVEITARTAVHIKPGFHAKKGSSVRISINPLLCVDNKTTAAFSQNYEIQSNEEYSKIQLNETQVSHNISVYPNPFYD